MRLTQFSVKGFKNFRQQIVLEKIQTGRHRQTHMCVWLYR
jgi:hypothetical protein